MPREAMDVAIVGAGAAGLAAAQVLAAEGVSFCVLEARDRIGGRIFTRHEPGFDAPLELGAEFVHGIPDELVAPARAGAYTLDETGGRPWQFRAGVLQPATGWPADTDKIFERLADVAAAGVDMSFQQFLDTHCAEPYLAQARAHAIAYVQGYQAAHTARIGIQGLVKGEEADEAVHSDRSSRVHGGYERVVEWLRTALPAAPGTLRLNTTVTELRWQPGGVHLLVRPTAGSEHSSAGPTPATGGTADAETIAARCAIITLPLGVLQQPPDAPGAVRFIPALLEQEAAMRRLHMGAVVKVVLRFHEPLWDAATRRTGVRGKARPAPLGFLRAPEEAIPTWWTQAPSRAPVLTGWTGGPNAERLAALSDPQLSELTMETLGNIFGALGGRRRIESLLADWNYHNWQRDPYSRGAYSYVGVHGLPAQEALARPVEGTLFFAGEATDYHGHFSTVHGAIATGRRAAQEVLATLGRR